MRGAASRRTEPFQPGGQGYGPADQTGPAAREAEECVEAGIQMQSRGMHQEALSCYNRAIAANPGCINAYTNKGMVLQTMGRTKEALDCLKKGAKLLEGAKLHKDHVFLYTNLAGVWNMRGMRYETLNAMEKAMNCFRVTDPRDEACRRVLAYSFDMFGEEDRAHACWSAGGNRHAWNHHMDGIRLMGEGDDAGATACFDRAIDEYPFLAEAHYSKGTTMRHLGRFNEALACFRKAAEIEPDFALAYNDIAMELDRMGRDDEALKFLDIALEKDPDLGNAIYGKGIVLMETGRHKEAVVYFERALKKSPDEISVHVSLGHAHLHMGRNRKALRYFERALKLGPGNKDALQGKMDAERALGIRQARHWSDVMRR